MPSENPTNFIVNSFKIFKIFLSMLKKICARIGLELCKGLQVAWIIPGTQSSQELVTSMKIS